MADAFIALNNQDIIVNKILNNLQTDEQLLIRVLTSLTALDHEPTLVGYNLILKSTIVIMFFFTVKLSIH